jgi:Flp pilus assembly protein TadG
MHKRQRLFSRVALPVKRRWRLFGRDERGVTVIEFAILALPFFTIIAAIMETALIFLAGQIFDSAVQDASRMIRTGRALTFDSADFREQVCSGLYGMFDCTSGPNERLRINVETIGNFGASTPLPSPVVTGDLCTALSCDWVMTDDYDGGTSGSIPPDVVLVRAYYKWPTIVNLPGFNFRTLPDGSRLLGSARVFMNEPF